VLRFVELIILDATHMSYKLYKIGCNRLVIKGTLPQEQSIIWL